MKTRGSRLKPANMVRQIDESVIEAVQAGALMHTIGDNCDGRSIELSGDALKNFGGCSYLGLERNQALQLAAVDATLRFGTQFSMSRAYLQCPLYEELEYELEKLTGGHVVVAPSTSLGHISAMPVLFQPGDAVLIDRFAHASLHTATGLLSGVELRPVSHSDPKRLESAIETMSKQYDRVWYVLDGLYSMHGDFAPTEAIASLLERHPKLHLYVDDAHSTSWYGAHGRGIALESFVDRSRLVVALSLNKAFAAAGGALVLPRAEDAKRIRRCGGPMLFSGPVQPPMLGAAVASAKLHNSPELATMQRELRTRIELTLSLCVSSGIPLASHDATPIFFVDCGPHERTFALTRALRERGFYTSPGIFPAVPRNHSGVRFTVCRHNTEADIHAFVEALREERERLEGASGDTTVKHSLVRVAATGTPSNDDLARDKASGDE